MTASKINRMENRHVDDHVDVDAPGAQLPDVRAARPLLHLPPSGGGVMAAEMLHLTLRRDGWARARWEAWADPTDGDALRRLLRDAVERDGARPDRDLGRYTLDVDPDRGRHFTFAGAA